jgi:hypothetical protein
MRLSRCRGPEHNRWGETFGRIKIGDSQEPSNAIRGVRGSARFPARVAARLLGPVSGQAPWHEHDLWHGRHRNGGLLGVFHAEPIVSGTSAAVRGGAGRSNCAGLFGIAKIPCDNHIRDMLDPASPVLLRPVFAETVDQLQRIDGGLDVFRRLGGRVLIALDGTRCHCSRKIPCQHCLTRIRGNGGTEYYHAMLAATLVAPGHDRVVPLEPEFIVLQDRAEKQDCENMAAKHWLATYGQRYAALDAVYLGDDLFSRQPLCQAVLDAGGHFIFVCKPSSHPLI